LSFYENGENYLGELCKQLKQNPSNLKSKLESIKKLYAAGEKRSYHVCVELAIGIFQEVLNHQIRLLINAFPEDYINADTKKPFWSGLKRFPKPLELDLKDPVHVDLIQGAANIYASILGLPLETNKQKVVEIASYVKPPPFVPRAVKFATEEDKNSSNEPIVNEDDEKEVQVLL
jgi:ubiquitin-activating enzyme E1